MALVLPNEYFESEEWETITAQLPLVARAKNAGELHDVLVPVSTDGRMRRVHRSTKGGAPDYDCVLDRIVEEESSSSQTNEEFKHFFSVELPFLVKLVQLAPLHFAPEQNNFRLLLAAAADAHGQNSSSFTTTTCLRLQGATLLAMSFLAVLPSPIVNRVNDDDEGNHKMSDPCLIGLVFPPEGCSFVPNEHKLRCFLSYFSQLRMRMEEEDNQHHHHLGLKLGERRNLLNGDIRLYRVSASQEQRRWSSIETSNNNCKTLLIPLNVAALNSGLLDAPPDLVCVDFANAHVGGGVFGQMGVAMEEMLFVTHPELCVAKFACEEMRDDEALLLCGARKYSILAGYAESITFVGASSSSSSSYPLHLGREEPERTVLAIDAAMYANATPKEQVASCQRDVLKALVGFSLVASHDASLGIATGAWGCGAYGGDPAVKAILQWLSASQAGVPCLHYHVWEDAEFHAQLQALEQLRKSREAAGEPLRVDSVLAALRAAAVETNSEAALLLHMVRALL